MFHRRVQQREEKRKKTFGHPGVPVDVTCFRPPDAFGVFFLLFEAVREWATLLVGLGSAIKIPAIWTTAMGYGTKQKRKREN